MVLLIGIIVLFVKYPETRKSPGDVIFALSIAEFFLLLHYFMSGVNSFTKDTKNYEFCQINSFLSIVGQNLEIMYNIGFVMIIYRKLSHVLKGFTKHHILFHGLVCTVSLLQYVITVFQKNTGLNMFGRCGFKGSGYDYEFFILYSILVASVVFTFYQYKKIVPNTKSYAFVRQEMKFYYRYMELIIFIYTIIAISHLIVSLNCNYWQNINLNFFVTINNFSKLFLPFIMSIVRYRDPYIKQKVISLLVQMKLMKEDIKMPENIQTRLVDKLSSGKLSKNSLGKNNKESNDDVEQFDRINTQDEASMQKQLHNQQYTTELVTITTQKSGEINVDNQNNNDESINSQVNYVNQNSKNNNEQIENNNDSSDKIKQPQQQQQEQEQDLTQFSKELGMIATLPFMLKKKIQKEKQSQGNIVNSLARSLRISEIFSMLCGIRISYSDQMNENILLKENKQKYNITPQLIYEKLGFTKEDNLNIMDSLKMISYQQNQFKQIIQFDKEMVNFNESLNLQKNVQAVQNSSGSADSGRSGEFFFFTYDNKLILKTMKKEEFEVFSPKLQNFIDHFKDNPDSLIVKIYGVFKFTFQGNDDYILVIRNLTMCPGKYVLKQFDLKGSTKDREVDQEIRQKKPTSVLKDKEFFEEEQLLHIKSNLALTCYKNLELDSQLLAKFELIDYSLLVMIINWKQYCEDFQVDIEDIKKQFTRDVYMMEDLNEEGVFYHIGLVDYLQVFNTRKVLELKAKNMMYGSEADVSVQEPSYYSQRFIDKIVHKAFQIDTHLEDQ